MSSTSDEVGHTATPWEVSKIKLGGDAQIVRAGEDRTDVQPPSFVYCEREEDAAFIVRSVNSHDSLVKALAYALPLAALALDAHRAERVRCGHDDITFTKASGEKWVGLYQREWDELEAARAALSQAKGGK